MEGGRDGGGVGEGGWVWEGEMVGRERGRDQQNEDWGTGVKGPGDCSTNSHQHNPDGNPDPEEHSTPHYVTRNFSLACF